MKRFIGILCSVLLCGTIFTSFSPSLDGRAVVADKDVAVEIIIKSMESYKANLYELTAK